MLFKVIHGKDVFELNPQLRAIEEFNRLTSRQMTYVILATDYKGPFRKLNPDARKYQAAVQAGYKFEKDTTTLDINGRNTIQGKVGSITAAVNKYNEIQYDEDYETLLSVSTLISQIRDLNNQKEKTVSDLEKAVKLTMSLDKLVETKKKLEEILSMREDDGIEAQIATPEDDTIGMENIPLLAQLNESKK